MDEIAFKNGLIVGMACYGQVTGNGKNYNIGDMIAPSSLSLLSEVVWNKSNTARPESVAVDSFHNVYAVFNTAVGTKNLIKFNPLGVEIWSKTDVGKALYVTVDSNDYVFVGYANTSAGLTNLRKLNPSGEEVWKRTYPDMLTVRNIKFDPSENIYVSAGHVHKLNPLGVQIWKNTTLSTARGMDVDSLGNVYVSYVAGSGVSAYKLAPDGSILWSKSTYSWGMSNSVAIDSNGDIYFANNVAPNEIQKYNPSGTLLGSYHLTSIINITTDTKGNLYVGTGNLPGSKSLIKFNSSFVEKWSNTIYGWINSVVTDEDGNIYVATYNTPCYVVKFYPHVAYKIIS